MKIEIQDSNHLVREHNNYVQIDNTLTSWNYVLIYNFDLFLVH